MTEPVAPISLEDVRARFLEAEMRLQEASKAVATIEGAATSLGASRESLREAGSQIGGLAERFGDVASELASNAVNLREGVDAIRLGDPAAIKRQIEELDEAFTAMQSVMVERLGAVADRIDAVSAALQTAVEKAEASNRVATQRSLIVSALALAGVVVLIVLRFVG